MHPKLRILYITCHIPCGNEYGARIRSYNIAKLLQRIGQVSLFLFPTSAFNMAEVEETKHVFRISGIMPLQPSPISLANKIKKEFNSKYFDIRGQTLQPRDRHKFMSITHEFDILWFHTVRIPDVLHAYKLKRSVLDVDDFPSQTYASKASSSTSIARRLLDQRMASLWRRRERLFPERFDVITVCSESDRKLISSYNRTYVIRNGFDSNHQLSTCRANLSPTLRIGFIGTLDYEPNMHGIRWFIQKVWPIIKKHLPQIRLRLIGKDSDKGIHQEGLDIEGLGWLREADYEISTWSAMIVPIHQGGGTRIKIAEGFARRCPVISTSFGAYGYDLDHRREAMIADSPTDFANACVDVITDTGLRDTLIHNAYQAYIQKWTWDAQAASVAKAVQHCLDLTGRGNRGPL